MLAIVSSRLPLRLPDLRTWARTYALLALLGAVIYLGYVHAQVSHFIVAVLPYWPLPVCWVALIVVSLLSMLALLYLNVAEPLWILATTLGLVALFVVILFSLFSYEGFRDELMLQDAVSITTDVSGNQVSIAPVQAPLPENALARANFLGRNKTGTSFVRDGQTYTLIPMVSDHVQFLFGFIPITVPFWSGDLVVDPDGVVERLTVAQAENDPRLKNLPLFPQELAYRLFLGYAFSHDLAGSTLVSQDGSSPLLIQNGNQLFWVMPVRQYKKSDSNPNSNPIIGVFAVEARTGHAQLELTGSNFVPESKAAQDAVNTYPKLDTSNGAVRYDQLKGAELSIWHKHLYYHWTAIKNGSPVARVWVAADSELVTVNSPSASEPDGSSPKEFLRTAPAGPASLDLSSLSTLSTSQLTALVQGAQAELLRRLNAK